MTRLDNYATCGKCGATAHDVVDHRRHDILLECSFCGWVQWEDSPPLPPANQDEFRFKRGRFEGLTFAQVDAEPNGRKYLKWMEINNAALQDRLRQYFREAVQA